MAAIAEVFVLVCVSLLEAMIWSFVGAFSFFRAIVSKQERVKLRAQWNEGANGKAILIFGGLIWGSIFVVGFGFGLPLFWQILTTERPNDQSMDLPTGVAEIRLDASIVDGRERILRIDMDRVSELRDTKDIPDLIEKFREISEVEILEDESATDPVADEAPVSELP